MTAQLQIVLDTRPLDRVDAELAVAGWFEDDRPLRGGAARADWRLRGQISAMIVQERVRGAAGEAVLLPSQGGLRAPRMLILGLGPRAGFRQTQVQDATRSGLERALAMGMQTVALSPLGSSAQDLPRHAQALLGGSWEAVREAEAVLRLHVLVVPLERAKARASIAAAIDAMDQRAITLVESEHEAAASLETLGAGASARRAAAAPVGRPPPSGQFRTP